MLIAINPKANNKIVHLFVGVILAALNKKKLAFILTNPHTTLVIGEDKPLPGGFAKGVGNLSPEIP